MGEPGEERRGEVERGRWEEGKVQTREEKRGCSIDSMPPMAVATVRSSNAFRFRSVFCRRSSSICASRAASSRSDCLRAAWDAADATARACSCSRNFIPCAAAIATAVLTPTSAGPPSPPPTRCSRRSKTCWRCCRRNRSIRSNRSCRGGETSERCVHWPRAPPHAHEPAAHLPDGVGGVDDAVHDPLRVVVLLLLRLQQLLRQPNVQQRRGQARGVEVEVCAVHLDARLGYRTQQRRHVRHAARQRDHRRVHRRWTWRYQLRHPASIVNLALFRHPGTSQVLGRASPPALGRPSRARNPRRRDNGATTARAATRNWGATFALRFASIIIIIL